MYIHQMSLDGPPVHMLTLATINQSPQTIRSTH